MSKLHTPADVTAHWTVIAALKRPSITVPLSLAVIGEPIGVKPATCIAAG